MKKRFTRSLPLILLITLSIATHAGAADKKVRAPAGMEILKVGDANVLVPKGTRMRKEGDLNVVEDISEYASRRFVEIDERIGRLELEQAALKRHVDSVLIEIEARNELLEEEFAHLRETVQGLKVDDTAPEANREAASPRL
ncbi:MAG: hypothetical protein ABH875_02820 [Candidatus Omnitrophota bacterium]